MKIFVQISVNCACMSSSVTQKARSPYESSLKLQKKPMNLRLHGTISVWPLKRRTCSLTKKWSQNFHFCSCLIPQFRSDCKSFTSISRAILTSTLSLATSSCHAISRSWLQQGIQETFDYVHITLKACFSQRFKGFLKFSENRKAWGSMRRVLS